VTQTDTELQIKAATRHAGRDYRAEMERARRRTDERLREDVHAAEAALDDTAAEWLDLLADALDRGDYSGLAILEARNIQWRPVQSRSTSPSDHPGWMS
jgi:hypothetical protein